MLSAAAGWAFTITLIALNLTPDALVPSSPKDTPAITEQMRFRVSQIFAEIESPSGVPGFHRMTRIFIQSCMRNDLQYDHIPSTLQESQVILPGDIVGLLLDTVAYNENSSSYRVPRPTEINIRHSNYL